MADLRTISRCLGPGLAALALGTLGCFNPISLLNPDFLSTVGLGAKVATTPGDNPAIVVAVQNQTTHVVDTRLTVRDGDGNVSERQYALGAGQSRAEAWICPISGLTLGDVSDLSASGAQVRLGNGGASDPFVDVEPFGVLLQPDVNFVCGDTITFSVLPSSATKSGYQIYAYINGK